MRQNITAALGCLLLSLQLALCLPACLEQQSAPAVDGGSAPDTKARVYIYRYKQFVGSALEPSVYCDEMQLARMDNGRYFVVTVEPGQHTFRSNDKQSGIRVEVKPGERYYMRVELATGFLKGHGRLVLVQKEQGAFEIGRLKPLNARKVKDSERGLPAEQ